MPKRPHLIPRTSTGFGTLAAHTFVVAALLAAATVVAAPAVAQETNPRFGEWKLQSDAAPPQSNIMTYEAYGDGGMKVTIRSTNSRGEVNEWGYVTLFDGVHRPVTNREGSTSAVEIVNERTTRIFNARDGRVTQIIINTLSEDGNRIDNEYISVDADGKPTRVTHAVYERIG